jgi:hypothetical protein
LPSGRITFAGSGESIQVGGVGVVVGVVVGIRFLSSMESLEVLNLDSRDIGDEGMYYLRNLKNLKCLDVFSGRVTDIGCVYIGKIRSLESLELCGGGIGDAGKRDVFIPLYLYIT